MPDRPAHQPPGDGRIELRPSFEAGHRTWRVRFLMLLSLAWGLGGLWAAYASFVHMIDEAGGVAPFGDRLGMALFIAVVALAFPIAMDLYARCYVVRIASSADGRWHRYTTLRWLGERSELIHEAGLGEMTRHEGTWDFRDSTCTVVTPRVDAPYRSRRAAHRRLPYILDDAGLFLDGVDLESDA